MNNENALKRSHERFLAVLANCSNVTHACKVAKAGRTKLYARRKSDEAFAQAWDQALELGLGALEDEALGRAFDRADKASHLLLMFMLKALRPENDRENHKAKEDAQNLAASIQAAAAILDREDMVDQLVRTAGYVKAIDVESQPAISSRES